MSAPWRLVARWPAGPETRLSQARVIAAGELEEVAREAGAVLVGEPHWEWLPDGDGAELTATADAVPAAPTREQWPDVVRYLAGLGWSDRRIGALLGVSRDSVIYVRQRHDIPAGVPCSRSAA